MPSTQYLQVPKLLPHRKSRSRSKSQPREVVVSTREVVVTPPLPKRLQSPPLPATEHCRKPTLKGFMNGHTLTNGYTDGLVMANGYTNGHTHGHTNGITNGLTNGHTNGYTHGISHKPLNGHTNGNSSPTINSNDLNGGMYTLEDCLTPPREQSLRERIVGAWNLESYVAYPTAESPIQRPTYPMTRNVTGLILYTPDGYMSAQMLIPGQQSFKRGEGEQPQWAEAGKRFFAYCGPYYISDEGYARREVLRHTFQVCNLPGWISDIQIRTHYLEDDGEVLVLGSEEPTEIKGDKRIPVLKWRRAKDNANTAPPPPTPQIKISGPGEP